MHVFSFPYGKAINTMRREFLIFLFFVGFLFLQLADHDHFPGHLAVSLFVIWLVFIMLIFHHQLLSEREDGS